METQTILFKLLVAVAYGIALGLLALPLSKKLALKRTEDPAEVAPLGRKSIKSLTVAAGIAAAAGVVFTAQETDLLVRNLLLLIPIFSISLVDAVVRKIPNPLLITMLVMDAVYAVYHCIAEKSADILPKMFIGLFVGMIVCIVPSMLKIPMGAGDIKYCAVIGLCIYATGYFQAMVLMSLFVALFYVYLKVTKKGDMKTQIPMGPFLSVGTVITMCYSLFDVVDLVV